MGWMRWVSLGGGWLGFTDFLWRVVVYPCNKDQEKRLMKVGYSPNLLER